MLLLSFTVIFNLWFYFKTPSKIDSVLVKKSAFFPHQRFSFSQKQYLSFFSVFDKEKQPSSFFDEKELQLHDPYFIFTVVIALIAISVEFVQAKNIKQLQHNNQALHFGNSLILQQNNELSNHLASIKESMAENSKTLQIIVHDLRSPIAAIVGLAGFMIDENKLADEDMEVINLIHTSGIDSLNFINEILERESLALEIQEEVINLQQLLIYCISQFKHKAIEKNQQIMLEDSATISLKLNREKIWRVVNNLISNAIKFSPYNSVIRVALQLAKEKVIISVKDQGIGIPENFKDKIFGANEQCKRTGTAGEKSYGMGLAIAKQLIGEQGGDLRFTSENGQGTTFFIELPIP